MNVYLVGIKGTGMASLATLLQAMGHRVAGCDVAERFATDAALTAAKIPLDVGFSEDLLPPAVDLVIHSSVYGPATPILAAALAQQTKVISYPAYVAQLSRRQPSWAVAGTHGKTTTVSVATHLLGSLAQPFPFYALFGGQLIGRQIHAYHGDQAALFEACEYQDHFLSYHLDGLLVISIEWEHVDYFADLEAVVASFRKLVANLSNGATFIYNADDAHVASLAQWARTNRPDLSIVGFGIAAPGPFGLSAGKSGPAVLNGAAHLPLTLTVGDPKLVSDHIGGVVLACCMLAQSSDGAPQQHLPTIIPLLGSYPGSVGRLEVMGQEAAVTFIDDYAHHPTEIDTSLNEVRRLHPGKKILVIFSPHTASRTRALMQGFCTSLSAADHLVIQSTFASARGDRSADDPAFALFERLKKGGVGAVAWAPTDEEVVDAAMRWLQEPAVCITMGAGNNRPLTDQIIQRMRSRA